MGGELFKKLRTNFEQVCRQIPDTRRPGHNMRYAVADFMKCAFAVFFFQHQSLLDFQRQMKEWLSRNNLETVFGVSEIPTDTLIRTVMDQTQPEQLGPVFNAALRTGSEAGLLEGYRILDGGVLIALDGVWYHSSETIHCDRCLPAIQSISRQAHPPDKDNKGGPAFVEKTAERIPQGVVKRISPTGTLPRPAVYLVPQVQYRMV
jgi:hypothetical protein